MEGKLNKFANSTKLSDDMLKVQNVSLCLTIGLYASKYYSVAKKSQVLHLGGKKSDAQVEDRQ